MKLSTDHTHTCTQTTSIHIYVSNTCTLLRGAGVFLARTISLVVHYPDHRWYSVSYCNKNIMFESDTLTTMCIYVSKTCFHLCVAVQTFDNWTRQRSEVDMCMGVLGNCKVLSEFFFFFNLTPFTSKISTGKLYFFQYFIQLSFMWCHNQKQNWKHTHYGRLNIWLLDNILIGGLKEGFPLC